MSTVDRPLRSVLVAEDDRVMADVIRFNLERVGYSVCVARNGTDAWEQLQDHDFDSAVFDYQMPGMTGEQVCRRLRNELENKSLPVIILSARGLELNAERLHSELSIHKLLFKPFSPRELVDTVESSMKLQST